MALLFLSSNVRTAMPEISVILPIYNAEKFIRTTIDSILNQSFPDFELICVNDGSTDRTLELLQGYASSDSRISIINQSNSGPGIARNAGLDNASARYVIMLDADDIYKPNMLEELFARAEQDDCDVTVCRSSQFDDNTGSQLESWWTLNITQIPEKDVFNCYDMPDFIFTAFVGWPWDKLYRRSFIEENHLRFPELSNSEDLYFVFLSLALAEKIAIVDSPLIEHRVNRSGSVSGSRAKDPLAFYKSTCLLKSALQSKAGLYEKVSWGFLNWAFTYMLWNIETMDNPKAREIQLQSLINDEFVELEIGYHSPAFFSLEPSGYDRYLALVAEASGEKAEGSNQSKHHRITPIMIKFLVGVQSDGFYLTIKRAFKWLKQKLIKSSSLPPAPKFVRGSAFAESGRDLKSRKTLK